VPDSATPSAHDSQGAEVFTLAEVSAYLRVPEEAILDLVAKDVLPAQKIGTEWRFLKRAVVDWLRFGPHVYRELRMFPLPWMLDHPFWDELIQALEKRILSKIPAADRTSAKRGSKEAVLKHFGVFQDDADLQQQLTDIRAQRKASE
jgi:excisionase family DNA binding protein